MRARPFDDADAAIVTIKAKAGTPRQTVRSVDQFVKAFPDATAADRACIQDALLYAPCVCVFPVG